MDENHQVLDVTYGNFACRLEGFDDSVATMKLVVSFFHDLAGHDRFMDTEPLAPDMETLARLTEEQTGHKVEAEGYDNKVSLRASNDAVADDVAEDDGVAEDDLPAVEEVADEFVVEPDAEDDLVDEAAELSSVADKLQRMRAAAVQKSQAASDDFSEDLGEAVSAAAANPLSQRLSELVKRTAQAEQEADIAPEESEAPAVTDTAVDEFEMASDDSTHSHEQVNVFNKSAESEEMEETISNADDVLEDEELNAFLAQEEAAMKAAEAEQIAAEAAKADIAEEVDAPEAEDEANAAPEVAAPLMLTPADAAKDVAEEDHDDEEFDLEAEVAKVQAELAAHGSADLAKRGLPRHVEDAMSRIMSQTDQHLNQPENRRHRDAFAQLKAAVAATEAARQLGDKGTGKQDPDELYKDDLGAHGDHEKGERKLSTPLKLVKSLEVEEKARIAESKASAIDTDAAPSARLRQIATLKEVEETDDGDDFADFVAAQGVTDLADQLEAAGAYICFVEGDADFSRPQVMKLVQSASDTEITREDGLRSFGRLLRQARLVKLANGRFQVSENTQFRPGGHKAAQG